MINEKLCICEHVQVTGAILASHWGYRGSMRFKRQGKYIPGRPGTGKRPFNRT